MGPRARPSAAPDGQHRPRVRGRVDVVLVSMPFAPLHWASLGLGLFQAALKPLGISNRALYLGIPFAEEIGPAVYERISRGGFGIADLVGEWVFSSALFDDELLDTEGYVRDVLQEASAAHRHAKPVPEEAIEAFRHARERAPAFVARCCREVCSLRPRLVCFTSVFHQNVASLALAAAIKLEAPDIFILFGGANCEGPMGVELMRSFPAVDAAVSGEADAVFTTLVERILAGEPIEDFPGVVTRKRAESGASRCGNAPRLMDLDALPDPDYDDFFAQWQSVTAEHPGLEAKLLFETSRGCWWGEKAHCTFCGLNGGSMAYRSKSARRAIDELNHLVDRYPGHSIFVVDSILDMGYFRDFLPMLAEQENEVELFYEVKANLTKQQLRLLRDAGVRQLQPGVETLSTPILGAMKKGVTALQNVQLLKWCKEIGLEPSWNFLFAFPGEDPEEYRRMARLMRWLTHLPAPQGPLPVRLDRFSPYYEQAGAFGITDVEPYPSYSYVYPLEPERLARLAYFFTARLPFDRPLDEYTGDFREAIAAWQELDGRGELYSVQRNGELRIFDTRPAGRETFIELGGVEAVLIEECDGVRSLSALPAVVERRLGDPAPEERIAECLAGLVERGLMLREGDKVLSLPIPVGTYMPSELAIADSLLAIRERAAGAA